MRLSIAIVGLAVALSSTETTGFVARSTTTSVSQSVRPTTTDEFKSVSHNVVSTASADPNNDCSDNEYQEVQLFSSSTTATKNAAMSLFMATVLSVSAAATVTASPVFPVEAAWAATVETTTTTTTAKSPKAAAPVAPPLSNEEKERLAAKKNLDLTQQTLKEYQKYVSDSKTADKKAAGEFATASKAAASAKKMFVAASDKLSAAKSQKMPAAAITELTADAGTFEVS